MYAYVTSLWVLCKSLIDSITYFYIFVNCLKYHNLSKINSLSSWNYWRRNPVCFSCIKTLLKFKWRIMDTRCWDGKGEEHGYDTHQEWFWAEGALLPLDHICVPILIIMLCNGQFWCYGPVLQLVLDVSVKKAMAQLLGGRNRRDF